MMVSVVYSEGQVIVECRGDVRLGIEGRGAWKGMLQKTQMEKNLSLNMQDSPTFHSHGFTRCKGSGEAWPIWSKISFRAEVIWIMY